MSDRQKYDAIVVGAGPNGLAAAITLAVAGRSVLVLEAKETVGGGTRSAELTLPGFIHDVCSAIHPLGVASPFFQSLDLTSYGLEWIQPRSPLAHPLDDGTAVILERSIAETCDTLGGDAVAYRKLMSSPVHGWEQLTAEILGPLHIPRHPFLLARVGLKAAHSADSLAKDLFKNNRARALFAGLAAHSILPLEEPYSAAYGLILGAAGHAVGWPLPKGGSQKIADAMESYLKYLGAEIQTGSPVASINEFPQTKVVLFDVTPRQLLSIAGNNLPDSYNRRLQAHRYGPGVFKMDWALDGPIPWSAEDCSRAATVHLGGSFDEIAASERAVWQGRIPEKPFVILAQPSLFDNSRAPEGKHTAWAYCHVPNGSDFDMSQRIEAQIERFAPGFRSMVLQRNVMSPARLEEYNPNYVGGDIAGGVNDFRRLFMCRAYSTPVKGWYICSSSTPPGAGVHGMCGYHAARIALRSL